MLSKPFHFCLVACLLASIYSRGSMDGVSHIPQLIKLHSEQITSAYPNPFTDNTTIFYLADRDAFVKVKLFNNYGGLMGQIFDDLVEKGATYQFELDGSKMVPGIYYYTIETEKMVLHRRIELVR